MYALKCSLLSRSLSKKKPSIMDVFLSLIELASFFGLVFPYFFLPFSCLVLCCLACSEFFLFFQACRRLFVHFACLYILLLSFRVSDFILGEGPFVFRGLVCKLSNAHALVVKKANLAQEHTLREFTQMMFVVCFCACRCLHPLCRRPCVFASVVRDHLFSRTSFCKTKDTPLSSKREGKRSRKIGVLQMSCPGTCAFLIATVPATSDKFD